VAGNRNSLYEFLLLATVVIALTLASVWVYPIWDDARVLSLITRNGSQVILFNFGWRILVAFFLTFLSEHQLFQPVGIIFHFIGWLGMGLVTMRFWRLMFPEHARLALLPSLLSVAPILCKVQFVLVTVVFMDLIPSVLAFMAILMLLREYTSRRRWIINEVAALLLIVFSILISEYAVAAAGAGFVLAMAKALREKTQLRRERIIAALLVAVFSLGSYAVYSLMATPTANPEFRARFALEMFPRKIPVIPFRLFSALWRGAIGGVLESLGSINVNTKIALTSFVCGAIFSAVVTLVVYKNTDGAPALSRNWFTVLTLVVATLVGLLPVFLMDRTLEAKWDSRFWLPVLPVLSSLTVFLLLKLVNKRVWLLVPIACGFLAGYWTTFEILNTYQHPEPVVEIKTVPVFALADGNKTASVTMGGTAVVSADPRLLMRTEN